MARPPSLTRDEASAVLGAIVAELREVYGKDPAWTNRLRTGDEDAALEVVERVLAARGVTAAQYQDAIASDPTLQQMQREMLAELVLKRRAAAPNAWRLSPWGAGLGILAVALGILLGAARGAFGPAGTIGAMLTAGLGLLGVALVGYAAGALLEKILRR